MSYMDDEGINVTTTQFMIEEVAFWRFVGEYFPGRETEASQDETTVGNPFSRQSSAVLKIGEKLEMDAEEMINPIHPIIERWFWNEAPPEEESTK